MSETESGIARRLDQIERTTLRALPIDVGKWAMTTGKPSAADVVVLAPADLRWLIEGVRSAYITREPSDD